MSNQSTPSINNNGTNNPHAQEANVASPSPGGAPILKKEMLVLNSNANNNQNGLLAACDISLFSTFYDESSSSSDTGIAVDTIVVTPVAIPKGEEEDNGDIEKGGQEDSNGIIASSDFFVEFPDFQQPQQQSQQRQKNNKTSPTAFLNKKEDEYIVLLQINNIVIDPSVLSMSLTHSSNSSRSKNDSSSTKNQTKKMNNKVKDKRKQQCVFNQGQSTKPSTEVLQQLVQHDILKPGKNVIRYILSSYHTEQQTTAQKKENLQSQPKIMPMKYYKPISTASSFCYLWSVHDNIIIVDIDGTVTKSDVGGMISSIITESYRHVHRGVCAFFTNLVNHNNYDGTCDDKINVNKKGKEINIAENNNDDQKITKQQIEVLGNIRVLYLSSRPIRLLRSTRKFLSQLYQYPPSQKEKKMRRENSRDYIFCCNIMPSSFDHKDDIDNWNQDTNADSETAQETKQSHSFTENENYCSKYDTSVKEQALVGLPEGPIFLHPGSVSTVLVTELIKKSTHEYKSETLLRQVVLPFVAAGKHGPTNSSIDATDTMNSSNHDSSFGIFLAGFGNKHTDARGYEMAGVKKQDIYIINKKSEIVNAVNDDNEDSPTSVSNTNLDMNEDYTRGSFDFQSKSKNGSDGTQKSTKNNISRTNQPKKTDKLEKIRTFSGYDDPELTKAVLDSAMKVLA
jgi:phosphatidate phosphatase PAH1